MGNRDTNSTEPPELYRDETRETLETETERERESDRVVEDSTFDGNSQRLSKMAIGISMFSRSSSPFARFRTLLSIEKSSPSARHSHTKWRAGTAVSITNDIKVDAR